MSFMRTITTASLRRRADRPILAQQMAQALPAQHADDAARDVSQSFHDGKVQAAPSVRKLNGRGVRQ